MVRLIGTVREVVNPVARWRADVEDEKREGTRDGELVVEHDGKLVRVQARGRDLVGDDARRKLAWSELVEQYGLALGMIPPFTEVKLDELAPAVGARIALAGEVTEQAFDDDGGLRDAPTTRPGVIRASVLAVGDDAEQLVERELAKRERAEQDRREAASRRREGPEDTTRWYEHVVGAIVSLTAVDIAELVMLAIACVLFVIAGVTAHGATDIRPAVGFACGVAALVVALRPTKHLQPFRAREKVHGRVWHLDPVWRCVAFVFAGFTLVMGLGIATGAVPTGPGGERDGAAVIAMFGLLSIGLFAIGEVIAQPTVRRLAALAGRDAIEGVVRSRNSAHVAGGGAVLARVENWASEWTTNHEGKRRLSNTLKSATFASVPSFTVETDNETLQVSTSDIAWASTDRVRENSGSGWQIIYRVKPGERVVVRGARDGERLRSHGTQPVLVFAGPAHPKRWAARAVRWRWFARVVLVASAAGLVWASGWLA